MRKFFIVFLSFYISSYLIMFTYIGFVEFVERSNNDFGNIWMIIKVVAGLSLLAIICFSPALLVVSTLQLLMKKDFLRYFLSFILMEIHGFLIFIVWFRGLSDIKIDKIINYFMLSILSTTVFLSILYFIDNKIKNILK